MVIHPKPDWERCAVVWRIERIVGRHIDCLKNLVLHIAVNLRVVLFIVELLHTRVEHFAGDYLETEFETSDSTNPVHVFVLLAQVPEMQGIDIIVNREGHRIILPFPKLVHINVAKDIVHQRDVIGTLVKGQCGRELPLS
mgnify:CR=1 FL=1